MDAKVYRSIVQRHRSLAPGARLEAYQKLAGTWGDRPLSAWERKISDGLAARIRAKPVTWFHGGLAGRAVGDLLLPSGVTGTNPRDNPSGGWTPKARVYVTHYRGGAEYFAGWNVRFGRPSVVYVVEPQGELTVDPEALRISLLVQEDPVLAKRHLAHIGDMLSRFCCEAARVLDVLELLDREA